MDGIEEKKEEEFVYPDGLKPPIKEEVKILPPAVRSTGRITMPGQEFASDLLPREPIFPQVVDMKDMQETPWGLRSATPEVRQSYIDAGWEIAKEYGPDTAMILGSYLATGLALSSMGLTAGATTPLALAGLAALRGVTAGTLYSTIKGVLHGQTPERIAQEAGENALFFGAFDVMTFGTGKFLRAAGKKVWEPYANKLWQVFTIPKKIRFPESMPGPSWLKGHSLEELIIPAIERLEKYAPETAKRFRESRAQMGLMVDIANKLGKDVQEMLPSERFEILKALRGYKGGLSPKAESAYGKYLAEIENAKFSERFIRRYNVELGRLLTKMIDKPEVVMVGETTKNMLRGLEVGMEHGDTKAIKNTLNQIIDSPLATQEMRVLARDLYELPMRTPQSAAQAAHNAARSYLLAELKTTPGILSGHPLAEHVPLNKVKGLEGFYGPRDIALEFEALDYMPRLMSKAINKWFMSPWKTSKVIMRPATHFRNIMSNMILNDWGGLPFYRQDIYWKALKGMRADTPEYKTFIRMANLNRGTFTTQELVQIETAWKKGADPFDKALSLYNKAAQPFARWYNAEERWAKFAKYLHNRELGMELEEAAVDAMKWTFNYGEITPLTGAVRTYAMPFFTWTSKAIPMMAHTAVHHPLRFGKWILGFHYLQQQFIEKADMSEDQWDFLHSMLPEYLQKGIYMVMPYRGDKGEVNLLNLTYILPGIGDVAELGQRGVTGAIQHPLLSIYASVKSNEKHSGAPIWLEWDSPQVKVQKSMSYVWQQLMPPIAPGGADWNTIQSAIEGSDEVGPWEAVASQFGLKITKQRPETVARRFQALQRIHEAEAKSEMRRELRRATTPDEVRGVILKYQKLLQAHGATL